MRKNIGFTLVELLVTITIIAILATVSLGTFRGYFSQARESARISTVSSIASILKASQATIEKDSYAFLDDSSYPYEAPAANAIPSLQYLLEKGGINAPDLESNINADRCYAYGYSTSGLDFFIAVSPENSSDPLIVNGTGNGIIAAETNVPAIDTLKTGGNCNVFTVTGYTIINF